ncbi:alpha/beta hydrolase [Lacinutrix sp. Hel_I_90]|uniref:alpha/beta hydrolase n=1 Tax=Lacinutrix sp. Hel_I_90 TaxID=1249999 RepID=UPI000ACBD047|nr:alpha/beta hydrolase-fold protein [Lacinutrix sp. Hel_I_90]
MTTLVKPHYLMRRFIHTVIILFCFQFAASQTSYQSFNSNKLGEARDLKIQLPRTYGNGEKSYPVIVVLDGDFMFEIVAGNSDYTAYWEDMPEAIVVGVNQVGKRESDNLYSETSSLPTATGAAFLEFISLELLPFIEQTYRTVKFKVVVGHGESANFINYFLLEDKPVFDAYIAISPDLAKDMTSLISKKLNTIQSPTFYYSATSDKDFESIQKETKALNTMIDEIENDYVNSSFDDFTGPSHYLLPTIAIPQAFANIFNVYKPISKKEFAEKILVLESSPVDYLLEKYQTIKTFYGFDKPVLINDFKAIEAAINRKEKYEYFEPLGNLARKEYPETLLGNYYLGRFHEETGDAKKAMKIYQSAYILKEAGGITKDHVLKLSDQIKADFGY